MCERARRRATHPLVISSPPKTLLAACPWVSDVTEFKREVRVPTFATRKDAPRVAIVEREFQAADMREEKGTDERTVPDTDRLVLPLRFVSPDHPDKVLVAVIRPTIFIQAEEDERKKGDR